jgi:hypothetical protein
MATPDQLARRLASDLARYLETKPFPEDPYGPRVRNAAESREHGWMSGALATVTFEDSGVDLIEWIGRDRYRDERYYFEAYSAWLVGVYRKDGP